MKEEKRTIVKEETEAIVQADTDKKKETGLEADKNLKNIEFVILEEQDLF